MDTRPTPALPDLAAAINAEHEAAGRALVSALEHARAAGELLLSAKGQLPHGTWLPWLREHCTVSERAAQGYMRLASRWDELTSGLNPQRVADLPLRDALALLAEQKAEEPPRWKAPPSIPDSLYIPPAGHGLIGTIRQGNQLDEAWIWPSDHEGFFHVAVIRGVVNGSSIVDGTKKPVRRDFVDYCIRHFGFDGSGAEWTQQECEPWTRNPWLYDSHHGAHA